MSIPKNHFTPSFCIIILFLFSLAVSGQQVQYLNTSYNRSPAAFLNPLLSDSGKNCRPESLNAGRFDSQLNTNQRLLLCETLQEVSLKLNNNWSPALKSEMRQIWQVFLNENVKIRPMAENVPSNIRAMAESFTEATTGKEFIANLYLRPDQSKDKSFFPIFIHELRHIYDMYLLWKNKTSITEAELERRAFRIVGKINQELPGSERYSRIPTFWEDDWKNLSPAEIDRLRDEKIERFLQNSSAYKHLLKTPEKYVIGYVYKQSAGAQKGKQTFAEQEKTENYAAGSDAEALPSRMKIRQTEKEIYQQVKEVSFRTEKALNPQNPDELLRAALANEKNLFHKMDNFVYDQSLQLQCWKKQKVTESFELNRLIARTQNGDPLFENAALSQTSANSAKLPTCILDLETIKSDATDTFWAAPYLEQMPVKFNYYTVLDSIPVARYTVLEPTPEKFNRIAAQYPNIKPFRAFVGTIFVSVKDSQIIKFWGTSFPVSSATGSKSSKLIGSYCATAIRQKLDSGIWVTTLLNTVAVTGENDKMKPFSYVVKYQNYRQAKTDVKILDDDQVAVKE